MKKHILQNSDIPLLEDEEPEESLYEQVFSFLFRVEWILQAQVKAKKSNEAQQKKEAKTAKRRLKRKVRKLKKGQFEVQTKWVSGILVIEIYMFSLINKNPEYDKDKSQNFYFICWNIEWVFFLWNMKSWVSALSFHISFED